MESHRQLDRIEIKGGDTVSTIVKGEANYSQGRIWLGEVPMKRNRAYIYTD